MIDLENYIRIEELGEGAQGAVGLYQDKRLGRKVAIKSLHPHLTKNEELKNRFTHEAKALAQLSHPGIVTLYDYIEGKSFHLIMEYVNGFQLDKHIEDKSGAIHELRSINIFIKILEAISFMHSKNIVHRDIKPSNIMLLSDDSIRLLDFGIAKDENLDKTLTRVGNTVGGSPVYMSPEHVKGTKIDESSDIYCLGVTLWQMLTGKVPYAELTSEYEIQNLIVNGGLQSINDIYPHHSKGIQDIVKKAMSIHKKDRYSDCNSFIRALEDQREKLLIGGKEVEKVINNKITVKVMNNNAASILINNSGFIGSELSSEVKAGDKVNISVMADNHYSYINEFVCNNDRIIEIYLTRNPYKFLIIFITSFLTLLYIISLF